MLKPFWLTYLAGGGTPPPLEILTIACLTFCLLLTDRHILGLPEYKLKVVNICKIDGTGGLEVVVLCKLFDRFQRYVKIARKSDEKVLYTITLLFNLMT